MRGSRAAAEPPQGATALILPSFVVKVGTLVRESERDHCKSFDLQAQVNALLPYILLIPAEHEIEKRAVDVGPANSVACGVQTLQSSCGCSTPLPSSASDAPTDSMLDSAARSENADRRAPTTSSSSSSSSSSLPPPAASTVR
jgi:hypothetical protein